MDAWVKARRSSLVVFGWLIASLAFGATIGGELKQAQLEKLSSSPTASTARVYFDTTESKAKIYNGSAWGDLGGSGGSGELNLISNPDDATGWTETGTVFNTYPQTASDAVSTGPLDGIKSTFLFANSSTSAGSETANYFSYQFTTPSSLSGKMKVEFYLLRGANFVDGEWTVSVYIGVSSNRVAMTTDVSGVTTLPAADGRFVTYVDLDASQIYQLRFTRRTNTLGDVAQIKLGNVTVGPGLRGGSAAISEWQSFSPTWSNGSQGTSSVSKYFWRRVGTSMEITFDVIQTAAGTSTGSPYLLVVPGGWTIDSNVRVPSGGGGAASGVQGRLSVSNGTGTAVEYWVKGASSTQISFLNSSDLFSNASAIGFGTTALRMSGWLSVPIAEWVGSGTLNVGQSECEYSSNSGATNASDTTSFAYGPSGSLIPPVATSGKDFTARFRSPILTTDDIAIQFDYTAQSAWALLGESVIGNVLSSTTGMTWVVVNATDVKVRFGSAGFAATPTSSAGAWTVVSTSRWRVRKCAGGQASGFGKAGPLSLGLISSYSPTIALSALGVSADYTVTDTDGVETLLVTTSSTTRTITPPSASTNTGRRLRIVKVDSGTGGVVIAGAVSGTTSTTINRINAQNGFGEIVSNGSTWTWLQEIRENGVATLSTGSLTNCTLSVGDAIWSRNGRHVVVDNRVDVTATTTGLDTSFTVSLPTASANFATNQGAAGAGVVVRGATNTRDPFEIFASSGAQTAFFSTEAISLGTGAAGNGFFSWGYSIQ